MRLLYLLAFLSFDLYATTCAIDVSNLDAFNVAHAKEIQVSVTKTMDTYEVVAKFPDALQSLSLSSVALQLFDEDKTVFGSQLAIVKRNQEQTVYFVISGSLTKEVYLTAFYGEDCQTTIWKKVIFSDET